MKLPEKGLAKDELFKLMNEYRKDDIDWRSGRTWAYVYKAEPEVEEVIKEAYMMFLSENALDPTAFPSLLRFEKEVIAMAANHLKGDSETVGNFTSGGTESIILAVKAARDRFRDIYPEIEAPEMVLPETAHAAFQKAGHYLDVKPVIVPVDPKTFKADVEAMRRAITASTILLVGSAISYAHGVIDPIREIGELALEKELLFHVDACMGGFMLPYFRRLGCEVADFELDVPGITSISMDLHKYAFAAKGASVVLYKNKDLRRYQIYTCADWTGYTIINPTVQSTKSGGPLAAAWAVLNFVGDDGYLEIARQCLEATRKIAEAVRKNPELRLLGEPEMNLLAFASDSISVFHLMDEMNSRGWFIHPQLRYNTSKENIHLSINPGSVKWVDEFIVDLHDSVEKVKDIKTSGMAENVKQLFSTMDVNDFDEETFTQMLAMAGMQGVGLPEKMAEINEILNALPVKFREKLLTEFINQLYKI